MRSSLIIKIIGILSVSICSIFAGQSIKGQVMRLRIDANSDCAIFFISTNHTSSPAGLASWTGSTIDGEQHSEGGGRWIVNNISTTGKTLLATLLAAKANSAAVNVYGNGSVALYSDQAFSVEFSE